MGNMGELGWISIEDALPIAEVDVWIHFFDEEESIVMIAARHSIPSKKPYDSWIGDGKYIGPVDITHWMQLNKPQPPKIKKGES